MVTDGNGRYGGTGTIELDGFRRSTIEIVRLMLS
jgi:hypothetical protein